MKWFQHHTWPKIIDQNIVNCKTMGKIWEILDQWSLFSFCPFTQIWKKPTWLLLSLPPFFCWEYFMPLSDWLRKLICTMCMLLVVCIMFQTTWLDNHRELLFCLPYFAIRPKFSMFCWLVGVGFVAFFSCTGLESTWCGKKFGVYLFILKRAMKFPCATTLALQSTISWRLKLSWCAMRFEPQ
jgi:hypothetical protein